MPFTLILAPEAVEDLKRLPASMRAIVGNALETHLRYEPAKGQPKPDQKTSAASGIRKYRLRVDDIRVFYDIVDSAVEILAIVPKSEAALWLEQFGRLE